MCRDLLQTLGKAAATSSKEWQLFVGYDHTMLAIPLLVPISAVKQHRAISSTVVGDQTETNGVVVFLPHYPFYFKLRDSTTVKNTGV